MTTLLQRVIADLTSRNHVVVNHEDSSERGHVRIRIEVHAHDEGSAAVCKNRAKPCEFAPEFAAIASGLTTDRRVLHLAVLRVEETSAESGGDSAVGRALVALGRPACNKKRFVMGFNDLGKSRALADGGCHFWCAKREKVCQKIGTPSHVEQDWNASSSGGVMTSPSITMKSCVSQSSTTESSLSGDGVKASSVPVHTWYCTQQKPNSLRMHTEYLRTAIRRASLFFSSGHGTSEQAGETRRRCTGS